MAQICEGLSGLQIGLRKLDTSAKPSKHPAMNPVLDAILKRRSVAPRKLVAPGPDEACLLRLVGAAIAAPDHGRLRPWRFMAISPEARQKLAEVNVAAAREADPDLSVDMADRERERAGHAPCLLAVLARIDEESASVPVHEQWMSVGAAVQNLLLAAEAEGFAAMIVSGRKVASRSYRLAFGLQTHEHVAGMIAIGTPLPGQRPKEALAVADFFSDWDGPA